MTDVPTVRLTAFSRCGGCAAKVPPGALAALLQQVEARADLARPPGLLVGTETGDDAAVFRLSGDQALVSTLDFIPPVCDDPYLYGEVAAANALSDVFAMGGTPILALAVCALPEELPAEFAAAICAGGAAKAAEAGAVVAGGHTVRSGELFYGLSVTGLVHPDQVLRNVGARPGDALVLTKPLGSGMVVSGYRAGRVTASGLAAVCRVMARLNGPASRAARRHRVHAATDVTGFGLAGHALGMARGSQVALRIDLDRLPVHAEALRLLNEGDTSKGIRTNRETFVCEVESTTPLDTPLTSTVFDPQTSGGLLLAVDGDDVAPFMSSLASEGVDTARVIGSVTPWHPAHPHLHLRDQTA